MITIVLVTAVLLYSTRTGFRHYSTIQYNTIQYCSIQYSLYNRVQYSEIIKLWDIQHVRFPKCEIFKMWYFQTVRFSICEILKMWDFHENLTFWWKSHKKCEIFTKMWDFLNNSLIDIFLCPTQYFIALKLRQLTHSV